MEIYLANGNPIIAMVLMICSTFKTSALIASFQSILLSFCSSETAKKFVEDISNMGCNGSNFELNNVVVIPDYQGSLNAAKAVYHAVNCYKDKLISVNEFKIGYVTEEDKNLLKDIEQYIKDYFGSDAITVK